MFHMKYFTLFKIGKIMCILNIFSLCQHFIDNIQMLGDLTPHIFLKGKYGHIVSILNEFISILCKDVINITARAL